VSDLTEARKRWRECAERYRKCCGSEESLYFHGKYWEGSHEGTWVEYGVRLASEAAHTYYIRDFDSYCDSEDYGDPVPYAAEDFWDRLDKQLDDAPRAAWAGDLCSCDVCGYHYVAGNGPCCDPTEDSEGAPSDAPSED